MQSSVTFVMLILLPLKMDVDFEQYLVVEEKKLSFKSFI